MGQSTVEQNALSLHDGTDILIVIPAKAGIQSTVIIMLKYLKTSAAGEARRGTTPGQSTVEQNALSLHDGTDILIVIPAKAGIQSTAIIMLKYLKTSAAGEARRGTTPSHSAHHSHDLEVIRYHASKKHFYTKNVYSETLRKPSRLNPNGRIHINKNRLLRFSRLCV